VNQNVKLPIEENFSKGEVVPFGDDFNTNADEIASGYTLQVLDSEILPVDEFLEKYDNSGEIVADGFTEYYYLVKVSVGNVNNRDGTESGISLDQIPLVGTNYFMLMDYVVFELLNPDMPGSSFSLQLGTKKEILIPYAINPQVHANYRRLQNDTPKLQLTEYPHHKLITLN